MTNTGSQARQPFRPGFPLGEAKLLPPAPRSGIVDRPRLVRLLTDASGPRIVSLIAPPGFGKTTLLSQWTARESRPMAWVTLDDLDNDPGILVTYLAAAYDRIQPIDGSVTDGLTGSDKRVLGSAVPRLLSDLHRWRRPVVLVLDDVHRLVDRTSLDALVALLDHLPPGFRVAIAGRNEPDLPFARLRAQRDLLEIGPGLLALDEDETRALAEGLGRPLGPDDARSLAARTEGWAAGIYLACLSRDRGDPDSGPIRGVSGADRFIAGYLRSEIGGHLGDEDATFLTRTSILETITPAIADAVTGLPGSVERMARLAHGNLLIQELGPSGSTYRYHNLLRDFLAAELERREPGKASELHRRAAASCAADGRIELAIEHATAGGDADMAADLATSLLVTVFNLGRGATVERWLTDFDETIFERHPPLAVQAAWVHLLSGRPDAADRMADIADHALHDGPMPDGSGSFESVRAVLRAFMCRMGPARMLADAMEAVEQEPPASRWRGTALLCLGSAHLLLGDADAADARFEDVAVAATAAPPEMVALAMRAAIRIRHGDWRAAERYSEESRARLVEAHYEGLVPALIVYAVGARVAAHGGDMVRARADLVRAQLIRPLANHAAPWLSVDALLELARAYLAISDAAGAQQVLREAEHIIRRRPALGTLTTELMEIRRQVAGTLSLLAGSTTLTAAELRLLPMLPTYLSFEEIGDRLSISRHTVKTQAMSIYGKLQASSRGEAVERAIEIGLLEPFHGLRLTGRPSAG